MGRVDTKCFALDAAQEWKTMMPGRFDYVGDRVCASGAV
jgi:hypothetical protein